MSKEYPCVYYDNEKCKKFSDDEVVSYCVMGPCSNQVLSSGDSIRAMSDEELAEFLMDVSMGMLIDKRIMNVKAWLKQPAEG